MTAEIIIMNKKSIAVAADSAVTIGDKVYHNANKIFALSKTNPVGLMIHGGASYCGIPWETIIKEYRRLHKDIKFNRLHSYTLHFLNFLKNNTSIARCRMSDDDVVQTFAVDLGLHIQDGVKKIENDFNIDNKLDRDKYFNEILDYINSIFANIENAEVLKIRNKISEKYFLNKFYDVLKKIYESFDFSHIEDCIENFKDKFNSAIFQLATNNIFASGKTGVVVFGFGDKDLYPELDSYEVGYSIFGDIQLYHEENSRINEENDAILRPYAQDEIIHTFIDGVHPDVSESIYSFHEVIYNELLNGFSEIFEIDKDLMSTKKDKLDTLLNKVSDCFIDKIVNIRRDFWSPTMVAIAAMTPTEIANLAESLISITSLYNHVKESKESVGGPTDVALVSKGDGFIWIKRKQYFSADLNPDFFKKD